MSGVNKSCTEGRVALLKDIFTYVELKISQENDQVNVTNVHYMQFCCTVQFVTGNARLHNKNLIELYKTQLLESLLPYTNIFFK